MKNFSAEAEPYRRNRRSNIRLPAWPSLREVNVLIMTSGHDIEDPRIYSKLACSVHSLGANVTIVGKVEDKKPYEVRVLCVSKPTSRLMRFLCQPWRCLWAARKENPDIIHFHDAELLAVLPVAKLWWPRAKFVYDVHEDFANLMLVRDWLPFWVKPIVRVLTNTVEKGLALLADAIIGVTPPLIDKFSNRQKIVAYNYLSQFFFEEALKFHIEARRREFDVVHLGTLNLRRARFLADTLKEYHDLNPNARSLVIGVTPEIDEAMRNRIPERCTLLGKVPHEQIPKLLANSKIGLDVHPWLGAHLKVALPVKVCEYMAAGCAVVSSYMPVLSAILDNTGASSAIVKIIHGGHPRDYALAAAQFVEAIDRGGDPGSELRQLAVKHMTWEGEATKIGQLYLRLLGKPCVT